MSIDVYPHSIRNRINLRSRGKIPVAILTTSISNGDLVDFDATTVDPLSVLFGAGLATEAHGKGHIKDVDRDGDDDLVFHFKTQETGIQCGDTAVVLTGKTFGGNDIVGTDFIRVRCANKKMSTGSAERLDESVQSMYRLKNNFHFQNVSGILTIYSLDGIKVISQKINTHGLVNVSKLEKGIYFYHFADSKSVNTRFKFIR